MEESRVVDRLARRLAAPAGRRAVLVALAAGLATATGSAAAGSDGRAASGTPRRRHPRHTCRKDGQCGFGEDCVRRRCTPVTGFSPQGGDCRTVADCSLASGPVVCVVRRPCVCGAGGMDGGPSLCGPTLLCTGTYDEASGEAATCPGDCECLAGLTCQDGFCRPAPAR